MCSFNDEDGFLIIGTTIGGANAALCSNGGSNKMGMNISINQVNAPTSSPQSIDKKIEPSLYGKIGQ